MNLCLLLAVDTFKMRLVLAKICSAWRGIFCCVAKLFVCQKSRDLQEWAEAWVLVCREKWRPSCFICEVSTTRRSRGHFVLCSSALRHPGKLSFIFGCYWMPILWICLDLSKMWLCNFLKRNRLFWWMNGWYFMYLHHIYHFINFILSFVFLDVDKWELFCSCKLTFIGLKIQCGLPYGSDLSTLANQH